MSAAREASAPPGLPGFEVVRVLGGGGFADVFLYRQHLPSRLVAVKVLLAEGLDDAARARFTDEANLMAQLSHHPSIVTVHQASVAGDGRPYLVMEYCSQPGLAQRYRTQRMGVPEVLRIGVRLASAVETAHRAGILHRDIKPANVLTTDFGWPALTDFGIAATIGPLRARAAVGLSVPWAAPEMLAEPPIADERSDVYCLAATLYTLLAGRSPFEVLGGANGAAELIGRIERQPLAPIGRADVPGSLQRVLARAMARERGQRYASALALGRGLQQVEAELALPVTTLDLPGEPAQVPGEVAAGADEPTRARRVVVVSPEAGADPVAPVTGGLPVADVAEADAAPPEPRRSDERHARRGGVAAGVVVVAAVAGLVVAYLRASPPAPPADGGIQVGRTVAPAVAVPAVAGLTGARAADGSVRFTWADPAPQDGDRYQWGIVTATGEGPLAMTGQPAATVPAAQAPGQVCLQVILVRADGRMSSDATRGCAG